jgi:hypothetical protein
MMKRRIFVILSVFAALINPATISFATASEGQFLKPGKRLLVKAKSRKDYKPRIVNCDSSGLGICLRDKRGDPADNPIEKYESGKLRVTFASWGITYIMSPDGTGTALNSGGKVLGPIRWELVPD